jgi:hypothetical protein
MAILLGFLPFVAFALLSGVLGATGALIAGAVVSTTLSLRSRLRGESTKILELGTLILFLIVAAYTGTAGRAMSLVGVRLCVDAGLLAIVLISLSARRPFTLQYAKEQVPAQYWGNPAFVRANYVISAAWAVVFFLMVIAEGALLYFPNLPVLVVVFVVVAALVGGVGFTRWYSTAARARRS